MENYIYVSIGSEVWRGVSDKTIGAWKNLKTDNSPSIEKNDFPIVHTSNVDILLMMMQRLICTGVTALLG